MDFYELSLKDRVLKKGSFFVAEFIITAGAQNESPLRACMSVLYCLNDGLPLGARLYCISWSFGPSLSIVIPWAWVEAKLRDVMVAAC